MTNEPFGWSPETIGRLTLTQVRCVLGDGKALKHPGAADVFRSNDISEIRAHMEERQNQYEANPFEFPARGPWADPEP